MKNSYIILTSALLLASPTFSQPTLNKSSGFQDGSLVQLYVDITPNLNEGSSGEDQTWDFSSLLDDIETTDYNAQDVSITPYANEFPMANVAVMNLDFSGNEIYSYFTND